MQILLLTNETIQPVNYSTRSEYQAFFPAYRIYRENWEKQLTFSVSIFPVGELQQIVNFTKGVHIMHDFVPWYSSFSPINHLSKEDLKYLEAEELLSFLDVLSKFRQAARYHHLDVVLGKEPE